jgi:hypothetical protein
LELSNLVFEKVNRVLSGSSLSLKGPGELERRLKLAGEGFEAADNVVWDVGSWLRPAMVIVIELCKGGFGGSQSTNLATELTTILVFRSRPSSSSTLCGSCGTTAATPRASSSLENSFLWC